MLKVQRKYGVEFVALPEGWEVSLDTIDGQVFFGPAASFEELRRPLTNLEAAQVRQAILESSPKAKPVRFCK